MKSIQQDKLIFALSKMFGRQIDSASFQTEQLQGGTLGDVRLVKGEAATLGGEKLPFSVVWKTQKKWERFADKNSWRREYDLYLSDLSGEFTDALRLPKCYHAEINDAENEIQLWMEYIKGVSGKALTAENENILCSGGEIRLIDWDTSGWGFFGEDIASLIVDGMDESRFEENLRRLVPAYVRGFSERGDEPPLDENIVLTLILIKFGYRMLQDYMFTQSPQEKSRGLNSLQIIFEMRDKK
ncbi:MAG: aminoglycoside phosphotransferase family protein [Clostridiales bacterium]|jgi:hypothetical protein|nr:aminoglycoside phosphotransferase family protein [Clostridiales bacterium]